MNEEWRDIPGYEGRYQASDLGRMRCLPNPRHRTTWVLRVRKGRGGYLYTNFSFNGARKVAKVHRMVALTFLANPDDKPQVNHKNGIKTDNRLENLEWCTASENGLHSYRVLGNQPGREETHSQAKLTREEAQHIVDHFSQEDHMPYSKYAERIGMTDGNIRKIVTGRTWKTLYRSTMFRKELP